MQLELSVNQLAQKVANTALDEIMVNDRPLREWVEILADVYEVVESYGIDYQRDKADLSDFERDILEALRLGEESKNEDQNNSNRD